MKRSTRCVMACGLLLLGFVVVGSIGVADQLPAPNARKILPAEVIPPRWDSMRVSLEVLQDGKSMRTVQHEGKTYLPVPRLGAEYQIRVSSHGSNRVAAIVSVDGLSVINGQPASETHPGYVVGPRGHIVIEGWRRNMEKVAAFSFEDRDKSYASLVGRPENIGVIGLVAVEEMSRFPRVQSEKGLAPSMARDQGTVGGTGTGYGRDIDSGIYYVPFVRSSNKRTVTIYYDTVENLRRAGIPVDRPIPTPFPADPEFVPPPPGR